MCQEEAWFDTVSIIDTDSDDDFISVHGGNASLSCYYLVTNNCDFVMFMQIFWFNYSRVTDCFPFPGNALGSVSNTQLLQYQNASCFGNSGCNTYEGYYESYVKIDGSNYVNGEKIQENNSKPVLPLLLPPVNFNDMNHPPSNVQSSQITQSTVIMVSVKRSSVDGNEKTGLRKY